jgi:molybdate transport system substrate-binding protein
MSGMATGVDIRIISSNAMREALLEIFLLFERASGHKPMPAFIGGVDIMKRMAAGETCDLVIMSAAQIDQLIAQGKIAAGSRVDLVRSGVGVAVRAGAPRPDISSAEAVKRALIAAQSIVYSSGPSGVYLANLFVRMGIADALKAKIKTAPPGVPAGSLVASGEAEIGFQQISELLPVPGIDLIGPLPADIQEITVFSGGIHVAATQPDAAKALMQFITSPAAAPIITKKGLDPA